MPRAVARALRLIGLHPSVRGVESHVDAGTARPWRPYGSTPNLPSRWRCEGSIRQRRPGPSSRSRWHSGRSIRCASRTSSFARISTEATPTAARGPSFRPEPCLVFGSVRELLQSRGVIGLVDQLAEWVERAALVRLNDPAGGWEITRRDGVHDVVVLGADWLRSLPNRDGGCDGYGIGYAAVREDCGPETIARSCPRAGTACRKTTAAGRLRWFRTRSGTGSASRSWRGPAGRRPAKPFIAGRYLPEPFVRHGIPACRARGTGLRRAPPGQVGLLERRLRRKRLKHPQPCVVILLARRPTTSSGATRPSRSALTSSNCRATTNSGRKARNPSGSRRPHEQVTPA